MGPRPVHALILAGGQSLRMGEDKAALRVGGQPQLQRLAALLARHADKVWISVRPDQPADELRDGFPKVVDGREDLGPVAGILAALESNQAVDWLVVAVDLPLLDDATIRALLDAAGGDPIVAFQSANDGLPEPLCALYRPAALPLIRAEVAEGIRCPRKILIRSELPLLELPTPRALDNMNTPEDRARLLEAVT